MAVKNIQYVWDISNTKNTASSKERSPLFPRKEKNQWYLEFSQKGNPLTVQLHQKNSDKIYTIQNLSISIGPEVAGPCNYSGYGRGRNTEHTIKYKNISVSFQVKEEFYYNHLLLANQEFSDFTIVVEDAKIAVHKVVLATRSPVFYAMLKNNLLEKNINSTNIIDFDVETISALIRFIYTGEVDLPSSKINVQNLLAAADKYEVKDLQLKCENYLVQNLKVSDVLEILIFAEDYNFVRLKEEGLKFMAKNLCSFSKPESLAALDSYPHLLRVLISKKMEKEKATSVVYADGDGKVYCYLCGENLHIPGNMSCYHCGGNMSCYQCGGKLHIVRDCRNCERNGDGGSVCYNCGDTDHVSKDCTY